MPNKRYRLTVDGRKYDMSEPQYAMLSKKKVKLSNPPSWNDEQRMDGLLKMSLFRKRNGAFERTKLGSAVYDAIQARVAFKATATQPEE